MQNKQQTLPEKSVNNFYRCLGELGLSSWRATDNAPPVWYQENKTNRCNCNKCFPNRYKHCLEGAYIEIVCIICGQTSHHWEEN